MSKWITFSDLCSRWNINQYDLAEIVFDGKLQPFFGEDFAALYIVDGGSCIEYRDGRMEGLRQAPLTVEETTKFIFRISDVEEFEWKNGLTPNGLPTDQPQRILSDQKPLQQISSPVNFFTRGEDKHWRVGFNGKKGIIDPLDGIHYIAFLLDSPGKSISCKELYQAVSGKTPDNIMSEDMAIGQGLNIGSSKQAVRDDKAKQFYLKKYQELSLTYNKVEDTPEGELIRKEIEKEMNAIMNNLKEGNFADPINKKAQINIIKRLNDADAAIRKAGLMDLAKHLKDHIKPDKAYGLIYTGTLAWDITFK
jgi:hypothetical protein